jgi:hypothetical protein
MTSELSAMAESQRGPMMQDWTHIQLRIRGPHVRDVAILLLKKRGTIALRCR